MNSEESKDETLLAWYPKINVHSQDSQNSEQKPKLKILNFSYTFPLTGSSKWIIKQSPFFFFFFDERRLQTAALSMQTINCPYHNRKKAIICQSCNLSLLLSSRLFAMHMRQPLVPPNKSQLTWKIISIPFWNITNQGAKMGN